MKSGIIIKRITLWFLCLLVLTSVGLNIYLQKKYKELSTKKDPLPVLMNAPVTVSPKTTFEVTAETIPPSAGLYNVSDDNIDDLEEQLSVIERELDKALERRSSNLDKAEERKGKEKDF